MTDIVRATQPQALVDAPAAWRGALKPGLV